jgi:hypothetical protein
VIIWSCDLNDTGSNALSMWKKTILHEFNTTVWHVSWSLTSNMLAVSSGDNKVTIWKENHFGNYVCINDNNVAAANSASTGAASNANQLNQIQAAANAVK